MSNTDSSISFDELFKHRGHEIECVVRYANIGGDFVCFVDDEVTCVKVICNTCSEVLWQVDNPKPGVKPKFC